MEKEEKPIPYHHDVVEFTTVAVRYCAFVEQAALLEEREFVDTTLRLLPLLYLKASLLPGLDADETVDLETFVEEGDYNAVRSGVARVMGKDDDYLDVFVEEMRYSDRPILKTISEDLADIYQDLRDYAETYRQGIEPIMTAAVARVRENFTTYWGQRLVNVMRALHDVRYNQQDNGDDNY